MAVDRLFDIPLIECIEMLTLCECVGLLISFLVYHLFFQMLFLYANKLPELLDGDQITTDMIQSNVVRKHQNVLSIA